MTTAIDSRIHIKTIALLAGAAFLFTLVAGERASAAVQEREAWVKAGSWHTLATLWNASAIGMFRAPGGAKIRVRYGGGWFARNRQKQTLDGQTDKRLMVSRGWSLFVARMQIKVPNDALVGWRYITDGP